MLTKNFLFLGCGKMGLAMLKAILKNQEITHSQIKIIKKTLSLNDESLKNKIDLYQEASLLPANYKADLIFLCVKPQDINDLLCKFIESGKITEDSVFISIIAGKKINYFEKILGVKAKIIRTMPNLAIETDNGILPYMTNDSIDNDLTMQIMNLFKNSANIFNIKDESLFDVITAIFGCGPGYIFLLQEILAEIAVKNGLDENLSKKLIKKLFLGSAIMSNNSNDFAKSRKDVTSKKGVTQALIDSLQDNYSLKKIFNKAIDNAISRSKNLS